MLNSSATFRRPFSPSRWRNAASADNVSIAADNDSTSAGGTNTPFTPFSTNSGIPAICVATTGTHSTALTREKRLLAVALRLADSGRTIADALPEDEAFSLAVHKRARTLLATGGADALAPARVRDDDELFALVAQLSTLVERDRVGTEDLETLQATFEELSRAVQLQYLDRAAGEWSAKLGTGDDFDPEAAAKLAEIKRQRRDLNPRARESAD